MPCIYTTHLMPSRWGALLSEQDMIHPKTMFFLNNILKSEIRTNSHLNAQCPFLLSAW